jgi:hypothetical protein
MRRCVHLHAAALQAFLVAGAELSVPPDDEFLARWIAPLLTRSPASPPRGGRSPG